MAGEDHGAAVLEVEEALQLAEVLVRAVGEGQVVEEEAGLKQRVLQNLLVRSEGENKRKREKRRVASRTSPSALIALRYSRVFPLPTIQGIPSVSLLPLWSVADLMEGKGGRGASSPYVLAGSEALYARRDGGVDEVLLRGALRVK